MECLCHSEKPRSIITYVNNRSQPGQSAEISNLSSSPAVINGIESMEVETRPCRPQSRRRKRSTSVTAESRPTVRKKISSAKSSICGNDIRGTKSTQTSPAASTGKDKGLEPFYDDACKEMSKRLRWHTKTASPVLDSKYWSSCWHNVESSSCVTTKMFTNPRNPSSSTISSASLPSSAPASTAKGVTTRLRKVILKPTPEVAIKLKRWMGCCRLTYNTALAYTKTDNEHAKSFYWLRNRFVNECNIPPDRRFILDTPKHVREGAVKDLAVAYKSNFAVWRKNPKHTFNIRFRSRKETQSITIPKASFVQKEGGVCFYPKFLGSVPLVDFVPKHDCKLVLDRLGRLVLHVPIDVQTFSKSSENQADFKVCAIDPGVRTFLTSWSPDGQSLKIGDQDSTKLYARLLGLDKFISSISKTTGRSKVRKKRALERQRYNIDNWKRDFHYQCAKLLTDRYDHILLPHFGSKRMSSKLDRRLKTKTVRSMLEMGHYAFRQRLGDVAERCGCTVYSCTEEYTSKTCSQCGWLHDKLGGAKVFKCRNCGCSVDRDLQGAFNIFLKYCKHHPEFFSG